MQYIYVLKRKREGGWYIGYTKDLVKRFKQHRQTFDCTLVYYEAYLSAKLARDRERRLKQYGSAWRSLRGRIEA